MKYSQSYNDPGPPGNGAKMQIDNIVDSMYVRNRALLTSVTSSRVGISEDR